MERGLNLRDPRLKRYLESLEPKYRKMLEDLYGQEQQDVKIYQLKKLIIERAAKQ